MAFWCGLFVFWSPVVLFADDLTPEKAVEVGRRSLQSYPWYDSENDSLRRIDVEATAPSAKHRDSRWTGVPKIQMAPPAASTFWATLLEILTWVFLSLVVAALIAFGFWLLTKIEARAAAASGGQIIVDEPGRGEADRIENLPFKVDRPVGDLFSEARRCYQAGDFGQAIIYLFSYQLVHLDRHQIIRLTKGKTNRQYLREVRGRGVLPDPKCAPLHEQVHNTMVAFEDVFFGHHPLSRDRFETCWTQMDQFHQAVQQAGV